MDIPTPTAALIDAAVELAGTLQTRATELQSAAERRQQAELDRMLRTPADKATLVQLTDQAFRSPAAALRQLGARATGSRRAALPLAQGTDADRPRLPQRLPG